MIISTIKTEKITPGKQDLLSILDEYVKSIKEKSVLAVTSKIVSICEGRVVKIGEIDKEKLIEKEADYFLSERERNYGITLTIKNNLLIPSAGIDESNGAGYYILWPSNPQKTANRVRQYLCQRFSLKRVGVIITDSKTSPMRWGVTGVALAHSGFSALKDYIGKPDIFNRKLKFTKANIADGVAAAAVLAMGEGNEQTPLALITDAPFVEFQSRNPTQKEISDLQISLKEDLYASLLKGVKWLKGKK